MNELKFMMDERVRSLTRLRRGMGGQDFQVKNWPMRKNDAGFRSFFHFSSDTKQSRAVVPFCQFHPHQDRPVMLLYFAESRIPREIFFGRDGGSAENMFIAEQILFARTDSGRASWKPKAVKAIPGLTEKTKMKKRSQFAIEAIQFEHLASNGFHLSCFMTQPIVRDERVTLQFGERARLGRRSVRPRAEPSASFTSTEIPF